MLKKFHFYRFEFKYIIPEKYKEFIKEDLLRFMKPDDYASFKKNKKYIVNSLYYDNSNLKSYQDKIDGLKKRFKLRLRVYSAYNYIENKEIFFEIKRKNDAVVIKDRGLFSKQICRHFLQNKENNILNSKGIKKRDILKDFLWLKQKHSMLPKIKVLYEREPFEGIYHHNLRITFDSNIYGFRLDNFLNEINPHLLLKNNFVMEVKFRGVLPYWFHQLIQRYQLQKTSFSKYCRAVELCYNC